jgi:hypothetical protein
MVPLSTGCILISININEGKTGLPLPPPPSTTTNADPEIISTTDWSYSAITYPLPYTRMIGNAGCFIDPLFSFGVYIVLTGALTAAASICSDIKGHCTEEEVAAFHSTKIREVYARFLLVVTSAFAQFRARERDFGRAFGVLRPSMFFALFYPRLFPFISYNMLIWRVFIRGAIEINQEKLTAVEMSESVAFCLRVIEKVDPSIGSGVNGMSEDKFG